MKTFGVRRPSGGSSAAEKAVYRLGRGCTDRVQVSRLPRGRPEMEKYLGQYRTC